MVTFVLIDTFKQNQEADMKDRYSDAANMFPFHSFYMQCYGT